MEHLHQMELYKTYPVAYDITQGNWQKIHGM